jgi:hypothetical protein
MKNFTIEFKRTSYITIHVQADNADAAEDAAWLELQTGDYDDNDADWDITSIDQQEAAK